LVNAEDCYHRALVIREKLAPGSRQHAELLAALAAIMRQKQQLDGAAKLFAQALDALETQVSRLGGADEVRSDFRAKRRGYYNDYIDLLLAEKQHELAFQVLERSRARSLVEMLAGAHVDIRTGVDTK